MTRTIQLFDTEEAYRIAAQRGWIAMHIADFYLDQLRKEVETLDPDFDEIFA